MARAPGSPGMTADRGSWRLRVVFGLPGLLALRLEGEVDLPAEAGLLSRMAGVGWDADLVLDVRDVTLLSATGMAVLTRLAARLADGGHRLLLIAGAGPVGRLLQAAHAGDVLEIFPSLDTALSALASTTGSARSGTGPAGRGATGDSTELERLRTQVRDLRDKLSTRPLVARALGMLQERYGLADMVAAKAVLRQSSQRFNVRMRELAAAFVAARPPSAPRAELWFPGRVRPPAPRVTFAPAHRAGRAVLLDMVLDTAMADTSATGGAVRLFDAARGDLVVERRRGLSRELVESLGDGTAWPAAQDRAVAVDVRDNPAFAPDVRKVLLDAGVRVVLCAPLATRTDRSMGTVSTLHAEPGPHGADVRLLERVSAEAGAWLAWHTSTVTLDALEHLHHLARAAGTR